MKIPQNERVPLFLVLCILLNFIYFLSLSVVCLITFAKSLGPDQTRQNLGPDLDPNCLTPIKAFLKEIFEKVDFEKKQQVTKKQEKFLRGR